MDIQFGVITVSDRSSRGERLDTSGPLLVETISSRGWTVARTAIIPDELDEIKNTLSSWADSKRLDVILTTGGTGFAPRDVTPEATLAVVDRLVPGIPEAMRWESLKITPHAMLSRMAAGIRKRTLIVNLPGSPKAALENFEVVRPVLEHAVQLLREDPDSEQGHLATKQ
jgi:molybdenum cofactor synthesis domain-containing protein